MKLARVQLPEFATPKLALVCDGALYDVASLEERWHGAAGEADFHGRVVAGRAAGLDALCGRLLSGRRPTEARIPPGTYLPLPPFDPARAAYVQLGFSASCPDEPAVQLRDARAILGDGQPVGVHPGTLVAELGLAVVLGDDLDRATPVESRRAVLGYTLVIDWVFEDAWRSLRPQPPSQLGPHLVLEPDLGRPLSLPLRWTASKARGETAVLGERPFDLEESLAFASHHVALRAGDVVGVGCAVGGRVPMPRGGRLHVELPGILALEGWAVPAPTSSSWRRSQERG